MELDRLFQREPWAEALSLLQVWDAMALLDSALQDDPSWHQRLTGASRLGVPLLPALLLGAADPVGGGEASADLPGNRSSGLNRCRDLQAGCSDSRSASHRPPNGPRAGGERMVR